MKINMFSWLEQLKTNTIKKPMPILSFPGAKLLGLSVKELINSPSNQARAIKSIANRTNSAACVSLMDLSVEAEAFGSSVRFCDDEVPTVVGRIVSDMSDVERLVVPPIGAGRTNIYIDAIRGATELVTDRPVFAGAIGPYSLAGRLADVSESMILCYEEPDMMHALLNKVTEFLADYICEFKKAGANGVVLAEPLAGMLSPALAEEFSSPYVKMLVDKVQDENFVVIYHNCGDATIHMIDSILSVGAGAYHFGNAIDISQMLELVPSDKVVMGNLSPAELFRNGTPDTMKAAVKELMAKCCKYNNFVISSGCDIPPLSSWDNIDVFFEAVKEFYENNR